MKAFGKVKILLLDQLNICKYATLLPIPIVLSTEGQNFAEQRLPRNYIGTQTTEVTDKRKARRSERTALVFKILLGVK